MSDKIESYEDRYKLMNLMNQPGDTLVEKVLNAYRSQRKLPSDMQNLSDQELMVKLGLVAKDGSSEDTP
jgi:hypothetical protein